MEKRKLCSNLLKTILSVYGGSKLSGGAYIAQAPSAAKPPKPRATFPSSKTNSMSSRLLFKHLQMRAISRMCSRCLTSPALCKNSSRGRMVVIHDQREILVVWNQKPNGQAVLDLSHIQIHLTTLVNVQIYFLTPWVTKRLPPGSPRTINFHLPNPDRLSAEREHPEGDVSPDTNRSLARELN